MEMCKVILVIALCVSSTLAMPYKLHENEDEEELYVLAPLSRVRRGASFKGPNHEVGASIFTNSKFGRPTIGGQVEYTHIPSQSNINIGIEHPRGLGTDVKAEATYNIIHKPDASVGINGYYSRPFGGPFGTGKPNYGFGIVGKYQFG